MRNFKIDPKSECFLRNEKKKILKSKFLLDAGKSAENLKPSPISGTAPQAVKIYEFFSFSLREKCSDLRVCILKTNYLYLYFIYLQEFVMY